MTQFVSQGLLVVEAIGGLRTYLRVAAFLSSIAMLGILPPASGPHHPLRGVGIGFLVALAFGILLPDAMLLAGFAQWWLNFAIWAPLFWIPRIALTTHVLWNIFLMLWVFNLLSSAVGVLQVYYPGTFAPSGEFVRQLMGPMADGLLIELTDGRQVFRPFGLSDTPGGAASAGSFSVLAGIVLLSTSSRVFFRVAALSGIALGAFCLYVCEVRSLMIFTAISVLTLVVIQFFQGRLTRAAATLIIVPALAAIVFAWSLQVGGERVVRRMRTLSEGTAAGVYYKNRGVFLEQALTEETLKYPVGAGLGRYGMMYSYFGDKRKFYAQPLWAEIQATAWIYDGGILLLCLGYAAVLGTTYYSLRLALDRRVLKQLSDAATAITALNVSWLAVTFNYPLFLGQGGMLFWLLNAALFVAERSTHKTGPLSHFAASCRSNCRSSRSRSDLANRRLDNADRPGQR
ncbi:MAG: hypothetical protein JNK76_24795 [Planctomycetales bacterium]|nr:hypothetical protein [Planctomycetales bacterium]